MKKTLSILAFSAVSVMFASSTVAESTPLQGLLNDVQMIRSNDAQINRQREAEFNADLIKQKQLLAKSRLRLEAAETERERLKAEFDNPLL